jgi:hypothetical protein
LTLVSASIPPLPKTASDCNTLKKIILMQRKEAVEVENRRLMFLVNQLIFPSPTTKATTTLIRIFAFFRIELCTLNALRTRGLLQQLKKMRKSTKP